MREKRFYSELLRTAARNEGISGKISDDFRNLRYLFDKNPDYVRILDSPYIPRGELMRILNEEAFLKMDRYMIDFLRLLSGMHMVHCVNECFREYEMYYAIYSEMPKWSNLEDFIGLLEEKIEGVQQEA
ncbi:MAG: F0F1 ATP synthase subunit delta [bacterium]|nr:F0F1 ATP synthase subunit delta [bacterium]